MSPLKVTSVSLAVIVLLLVLLPPLAATSNAQDAVISGSIDRPVADGTVGVERTQDPRIVPKDKDLVTVSLNKKSVTFWPYTGSSFDAMPIDPVNLIFVGEADPVEIRSALLALDGDRSAYGFPSGFFPFDQRWTDAVGGDVQVSYERHAGWIGSVIQLTLGVYGPLRVHLRLFRTAAPSGSGGIWTLGAAHFELQIPGTTSHQVLSWELAKEVVSVDMLRSGLIDGNVILTDRITANPSWRTIPAVIFNQLPDDLRAALSYPPGPIDTDFPIPNNGTAPILHVLASAPLVSGRTSPSTQVEFGQLIPKPFCNQGPNDYIYVTGPVDFTTHVDVSANGKYKYTASSSGALTVTPWDILNDRPAGNPYTASIRGSQSGHTWGANSLVQTEDSLVGREGAGKEIVITHLQVAMGKGRDVYDVFQRCLQSPTN
jgi:hypothetical protein